MQLTEKAPFVSKGKFLFSYFLKFFSAKLLSHLCNEKMNLFFGSVNRGNYKNLTIFFTLF